MTKIRKKVLYIITKSNWGGAQRYVFDLATSLPREQFDVTVAFGQEGRLASELRNVGVAVHPIPALQRDISLKADIKSLFELYRLCRRLHPDVVHLNSSKAGGLGALAARLAGVPRIIFTAHGWPFWEKRNAVARGCIWLFSWLTALLAHTTICVSDYDLHIAHRMPFVGNKAVRIYNGIGPIDFFPPEPHEAMRVLTNGELNDNKNLFIGIDSVVEARSKGVNISYAIMSDGELRAELEKYITKKGYGDFVTLLGFVPNGARQYKRYDVFFLPSKKEGLPYVLLEAGLAGLPVVASRVGGIPEIVEENVSGILKKPSDLSGFADALATLAESISLREKFGESLKKRVGEKFSLEQMLQETEAVY